MKRAGLYVFLLLLAGCAVHTPPPRVEVLPADARIGADALHQSETGLVAVGQADPYRFVVDDDQTVQATVRLSRAYYAAAQADLKRDRVREALENFELAVAVITQGGLDLDQRPDVRAAVDALNEQAAAATGRLAELEASDFSGSPEPASSDEIASFDLPEPSQPRRIEPTGTADEAPRSLLVGDMPLEVNNQVLALLKAYKGDLKEFISAGFQRSGRYLDMVRATFAEEGIPQDLAWLALVESAFKPRAYSRARAKGLWQFISSTGRVYGLDSDWWVDERADPVKATQAAARHLKDLHREFGDWYLAMAAYNAGSGKVKRAIRKVGSRDYWKLARSRYLRRETRNYVPGYLATLVIADNPFKHGFDFELDERLQWDEVEVPSPFDLAVLAKAASSDIATLRALNPELRRGVTPGNRDNYRLKVPHGTASVHRAAVRSVPTTKRLRFARHRVSRGETLAGIASRYSTSVKAIMAANSIKNPHRIRQGASLVIPTSGYVPSASSSARRASSSRSKDKGRKLTYRVRRGDNLYSIARRFSTSVASLVAWNSLPSPDKIRPGKRLVIHQGKRVSSARATKRAKTSKRRVTHEVKQGDSLYAIARSYGVSVSQLRAWNKRARGRYIRPGDKLSVFLPQR